MDLIQHRIEADKKLTEQLLVEGDDPELARYVDHFFQSESSSSLQKLDSVLEKMGFTHLNTSQPEEAKDEYYRLECTTIDCTDIHSMNKTSVLMTLLAQQFAVEYVGWGTGVSNESGELA